MGSAVQARWMRLPQGSRSVKRDGNERRSIDRSYRPPTAVDSRPAAVGEDKKKFLLDRWYSSSEDESHDRSILRTCVCVPFGPSALNALVLHSVSWSWRSSFRSAWGGPIDGMQLLQRRPHMFGRFTAMYVDKFFMWGPTLLRSDPTTTMKNHAQL
jgi:hypothetical protein